ncbi:O-antigen ligase family protein [Coraliomargarita sp. SDUM461004]|uniref:O-antigen ligase family protein n=1 Tax=Thalassobacterium sedimentorum TaxID=3041258 RepID=A0ABU1AQ86_9BACT|nr:O-antigen ligase family protein [Coraliomargarita sp. SDUM461004]MDQ8195758.1 O-antigen ligase family protein [Coraliomargarita sp. SDUM461004]
MYLQTIILVLFAVWSLGGRMEGAITWIAALSWSSLLAFVLCPRRLAVFQKIWGSWQSYLPLLAWLILIFWLLLAPFNAQWRVITGLDGSVSLEPLVYFSGLPAALVEARCREYGLLLSGLMVQAMVLWHFLERSDLRPLLTVIAWNSIIAAAVGVFFKLAAAEKILGLAEPVTGSFFASFRYHNHWTAFALLSLGQCLSLGAYWYRRGQRNVDVRRKRPDLIWFSGLLLLSLTLPLTAARAGVLFLVLFWLGLACWFLVGGRRASNTADLTAPRRYWTILIPCFAIVMVIFSIWGARQGLLPEWRQTRTQLEQVQNQKYEDLDHPRTDSWGDCWRMLQDSPVWGWGPGSHLYLYQLYAREEYRYESGVVKHIKEFAHNDLMQFLAELGAVGLLLLLLPPAMLFLRYSHGLWRSAQGLALFFPCVLILMLASFEFPFSNPAVLTLYFVQATLAFKYACNAGRGRWA